MRLSDVSNNIGLRVYLNGIGDLAFDSEFRPYLFPCPKVPCDSNSKYLTVNAVNAVNVDPIEKSEQYL